MVHRVGLFSLRARSLALIVLSVMLLVRLGPLCETMAMAESPTVSAMVDCAGKSSNLPAQKVPPSSCAIPCAAVAGEAVAHVEPIPFSKLSPLAVAQKSLHGLATVPATPPPQIV